MPGTPTSAESVLVEAMTRIHKPCMTRTLLIGGLAALVPISGLNAQEAKEPANPAATDARKESVANLETHIAQREKRLAEWGRDIVDLDARIEKRVDELVNMLAGMRDSGDSGTKVTKLKQEAIAGLQRGMDIYAGKRREVAENIKAGDTAALGDLDKFDERILKRVDQIAELTKSIPTHQDVAKFETDGASYWNGYYFENSRISEEWKQNRRDTSASNKQRAETAKSLKDGIDRLDKRRSSLENLLSNRKATDAAKKLYTRELGKIDAYEDHLKAQLRDVTVASVEGGQPVGMDQAHDISQLLDDARRDLRDDVARLFRTYDEFARGRTYIEQLKANLAARKKWLEQNPAAQPK